MVNEKRPLHFVVAFVVIISACNVVAMLNVYNVHEVSELTHHFNVFVAFDFSKNLTLDSLKCLFKNESIVFGFMSSKEIALLDSYPDSVGKEFALFRKKETDRKCLMKPDVQVIPKAIFYNFDRATFSDLVEFINNQCFYFMGTDGALNHVGKLRKHILSNLYHVELDQEDCERVKYPISQKKFLENYLILGRPVIFENAIKSWPAISKWTNNFLRETYGSQEVHIKLTPHGEFEGCDKAEKFLNYKNFKIPKEVLKKLRFPDLVVVRPAVGDIKFSKFIDIIEDDNEAFNNISAYLEYSSIREYFKNLEADIDEVDVIKNVLKLRHLNIWLSNGNTLGKLHFDPYDNFLCQIRGEKHLTLYEPHDNKNLYEAHIQEAVLSYDWKTSQFQNYQLLDSTSMVMSPVDIKKPDYDRFPNFKNAKALKCVLKEGDVLFMPSFWWHEVQSKPNINEKRNLAVNFWYEPFFNKEFPCEECRLDVNTFYKELLTKLSKTMKF